MSGQVTIRVLTQDQRDAETGWDEGDLVYVISSGLTSYSGSSWASVGAGGGSVQVKDIGAAGSDYFYFVPDATFSVFYGLVQDNGNAVTGIAGGPNGETPTDGLRATIINGTGSPLYIDGGGNAPYAYPNGDHGQPQGTDPTFGFDFSNLTNALVDYFLLTANNAVDLIYNGDLSRWQLLLATLRAAVTATTRLFEYDFTVDGGTVGAINLRAIDGLGFIANSWVIQNAELDVLTPLDSAGSATVEMTYDVAGDLVASAAFDAEPWATAGLKATEVSLGDVTTHIKLLSDGDPHITVGTADLTAGRFRLALTGWLSVTA